MTYKIQRRSLVRALVLLLALVVIAQVGIARAGVASASSGNTGVIPPTARPFGHTYGEWSNLWFRWAYSIPITRGDEQAHPLFDTTGVNCSRNQSGPVFFLAGVFRNYSEEVQSGSSTEMTAVPVDRTQCVVPSGMAILFPILNVAVLSDGVETEARMHAELTEYVVKMEGMAASIDGVEIKNWKDYMVGPDNPFGSATLPADNVFDYFGESLNPGAYQMGTSGYYLMLSPLSVGQHTIHFAGTSVGELAVDVTYHLTVSSSSQLSTAASTLEGKSGTGGLNYGYLFALILLASGLAGVALIITRGKIFTSPPINLLKGGEQSK